MLLQFQLEVQTQQFGQIRGWLLTIWSILSHVKCLVRKTQFAWFWTNTILNRQSQPSLWQNKMTFPWLPCHPILHISYGHWTAPSLFHTEHMATLNLMTGYSQTQTNLQKSTVLQSLLQNLSARHLSNITEKRFHMTGIYTLNENSFEDEFLSSCVTDRH